MNQARQWKGNRRGSPSLAAPGTSAVQGRREGRSIMHSPFPGMDPYLEQHWGDVHHNLVSFAEGWLNERLPRDLRARAQERVVVSLPGEDRGYYPDVRVAEHDRPK